MIDAYLKHEQERNAQGIPALPLNPEQAQELCRLLENPPAGKEEFLFSLFKNRISPGFSGNNVGQSDHGAQSNDVGHDFAPDIFLGGRQVCQRHQARRRAAA